MRLAGISEVPDAEHGLSVACFVRFRIPGRLGSDTAGSVMSRSASSSVVELLEDRSVAPPLTVRSPRRPCPRPPARMPCRPSASHGRPVAAPDRHPDQQRHDRGDGPPRSSSPWDSRRVGFSIQPRVDDTIPDGTQIGDHHSATANVTQGQPFGFDNPPTASVAWHGRRC